MAKWIHSTLVLFVGVLMLAGCASQQTVNRSSVINYLYPKGTDHKVETDIPNLTLPLKVGIAFVPQQSSYQSNSRVMSFNAISKSLSESLKLELLENVASHFRPLEYVETIEIIPSDYLTPGGSFTNLEQLQSMYDVDVIALVSFDQVQLSDENLLSFSYWTLLGAYIVNGQENDTNTLMDTAVFDIKSRKLLFRAPGTSKLQASSTFVSLDNSLREDSEKGFKLATEAMIVNLDQQLESFKQKVKAKPENYVVSSRQGYHGGATYWLIWLLSLSLISRTIFSRK